MKTNSGNLRHPMGRRGVIKRTLIGLLVIMLSANGVFAMQEINGQIRGTVKDEQGAVLAGASVTATHLATNTVYRATSSGAGLFTMPSVRLGRYNVVLEAANFRRTVIQDVNVEVGTTATLNVTLQVGTVQEEVQVTAGETQEVINSSNAEIGAVVDERRVLELPLNGRNASHLLLMQAGVYFERNPDGEGDKLIIHGQRHRSLSISLDGVDTQDNYNRASSIMIDQPLIQLTAENVQEFQVITGLGTAEFGRGGAHINAVTRGGGNEFHGAVSHFHRNTIFNANEFFNNAAQPGVERPPLIRNQFAARIGGPIFKDKTFFFVGYEGIRESRGIPVLRTVYTAEARQGIFRYLDNIGTLGTTPEAVAANPGLIRSVNLFACGGAVTGIVGRDCVDSRFNNGFRSTVDPTVAQIMALVPLPNNFDVGDGLNTGGFRFNAKSLTDQDTPSLRIDHRFNEDHVFYGSFNYLDRNIDGDFINGREPRFPDVGSIGSRVTHSRAFSGTFTSTFSPKFINEVRFGLTSGENAFLVVDPLGQPFTLDFNNITDPVHQPGNGDDVRTMRNYNLRDSISWIRGNHQIKAGVEFRQKSVNTYSLDEIFPDIDFNDGDNPPGFSETDLRRLSTGGAVTDIETPDFNRARDMMNDFMGAIGQLELRFTTPSVNGPFEPGIEERRIYRNRELDLFFNDVWKLRPNLTLNLGLRWEYASVPIETQGLSLLPEGGQDAVFGISGPSGLFNPGTFQGSACAELGGLPMARTTANATNLILNCSTKNVPAGARNGIPFWDNDLNNFAPIVSVAWDPWGNGKTSIRGGFRLSYFQDAFSVLDGNLDDNEGLTVDQDCEPANGNCVTNPLFLRLGIPTNSAPAFQVPAVRTILNSSTIDFRTYDDHLLTPYYEEYTLGISREFFDDWAVEIRYVGNRGRKLRRVKDFNEPNIFAVDSVTGMSFLDSFILAQRNLTCNRASGAGNRFDTMAFPCSVTNPLMDVLMAGEPARIRSLSALITALDFNSTGQFVHRLTQVDTSAPAAGQSRIRGGSFWGAVLAGRLPANFFSANPFVASARALVNDSFSNYNAVELEVRRRFSGGLTLQVNYNFSRALADFDGDENTLLNEDRLTIRDTRYEYGDIVPRHQFNANWIYELPLGPNKLFGSSATGALRRIIEGWQIGGIVNWRSGRPLSITSGVGTFTRNALSGSNSVDAVGAAGVRELRELTGAVTKETGPGSSGVFWLDPKLAGTLLVIPQPGRAGTLPRTAIFGPRRFTTDINVSKRTTITETTNIEFRWEVFNLFNNTNFDAPVTNIQSVSFGQIFRTVTNPRLMQFALKFNF
ncbi:MAG: TonB-dependent receptor [Blastocatellia bacterium]|nr:TonB-dependent receptor [Blastocatellia bacterium]